MAVTVDTNLNDMGHREDPVSVYEKHRKELARAKIGQNLLLGALFIGLLVFSVVTSQFYPERLAQAGGRVFEYFGTIMPNLEWDKLLLGRDDQGRAVEGSLTFWYTDFSKYMALIWETILMAITATILGTAGALALCFAGSRNLIKNSWIYFFARRFMEICRGVPEILIALVFVFAFGIGPLAGILAIAIHSTGALGKLFAEVNENVSQRPIDGIRGVGGNWFEQMRYGVLPQVLPNFVSYGLLRFEINVRASSIIGFVGAGGIGQELNRVISFYSDDRVLAVLILVVLTVTIIDLISEHLRMYFIGKEQL
ncbi:MAG: phosphonate ABC transporter, permease protein PhnE [Hyphomicrobiales bacterium]|jgi:phosphonate transport system permease protein